jgi:hypothetical protein
VLQRAGAEPTQPDHAPLEGVCPNRAAKPTILSIESALQPIFVLLRCWPKAERLGAGQALEPAWRARRSPGSSAPGPRPRPASAGRRGHAPGRGCSRDASRIGQTRAMPGSAACMHINARARASTCRPGPAASRSRVAAGQVAGGALQRGEGGGHRLKTTKGGRAPGAALSQHRRTLWRAQQMRAAVQGGWSRALMGQRGGVLARVRRQAAARPWAGGQAPHRTARQAPQGGGLVVQGRVR